MKNLIRDLVKTQSFFPGWLGIFLNPFYFARRGLAAAMKSYAPYLTGKLLDVGCGVKPYSSLFTVNEYIGLDIEGEHSRNRGIADEFYDGTVFPFSDEEFDAILCNQVLEHVFNPDEFLGEIRRVMKKDARMLLTVPFVWDEHEQPYDYARYSSFGLKALLKKNGLEIIAHEKIGADISILFQLFNTYLYKVTNKWNKYPKFLFTIFVMGLVNLVGLIVQFISPKNPDLFLDHVVLVGKSS